MSEMKTLSILIPVFNEHKTILSVLEKVIAVPVNGLSKELIIVDDMSVDGTRELLENLEAEKYSAKVFYHEKNLGKGAALRTAQKHITGDIVIIQDADLEYDPSEYAELTKPIIDGSADVVYGSRLTGAKMARAFMFSHLIGNKFLSLLTNILYDSTLTDMETCYKVFRADVFKRVKIRSNRFDFEPEITAKVLKQKIRLYEMPITYYGRDHSEGKKITWKDGFAAIWALIRYRFFD
jgi:glycosyltransferase involved in cell wall biosynthesis